MDKETSDVVPVESSVPALPTAEELAAKIVDVLDLIGERMALESPHPSTRKRVRGSRTVSRAFVVALIAAVETIPALRALGTFDPAEARKVLQSMDAYRQVAERTTRLLASINYTVEAQWTKIAEAAMLTMSVAAIHAKNPGEGELAAVVENLRKLLGRKGRGEAKKTKRKA